MSDIDSDQAAPRARLAQLQSELAALETKLGIRKQDRPRGSMPPSAESTLADLIRSYSTDFLSVHTIDGIYVYASPNAIDLFGLHAEELIGRQAYDFFHPDDLEEIARDHAAHLDQVEDRRIRYRLIPHKGRARWVETRSRSTPDGQHIVCLTRDIHGEMREHLAQKAREEHFRREAYTDFLTQLPNRRALEEALEREYARAIRKGYPFSIVLYDIDNFKTINDGMGHTEGDRVLQRVGHLLASRRRRYDTLGRWGGDEFLLLLPETSAEQGRLAGEQYRALIAQGGIRCGEHTITLSGGLACWSPSSSIDEILAEADEALYRAKAQGRNRLSS